MDTAGWSQEQLNGLAAVRKSLCFGLGWLAAEGIAIYVDVTDKMAVPNVLHAIGFLGGVGLTGSNLLYLRDLRVNPPPALGQPEQIEV